jgi:hypothetical protein
MLAAVSGDLFLTAGQGGLPSAVKRQHRGAAGPKQGGWGRPAAPTSEIAKIHNYFYCMATFFPLKIHMLKNTSIITKKTLAPFLIVFMSLQLAVEGVK